MDSEGENSNLPTVSQDYEGDENPASTGPSKVKVTFGPGTVFDRDKSARAASSTASEGGELVMPDMINLETLGLRRSPRLATQERTQYAYTSLMKFCAFGMLMASSVADPVAVLSHGQACVNSAVYQCEVVNSNFDKSLNHIHHMVLAAGQTTNEVYTFKDMLK